MIIEALKLWRLMNNRKLSSSKLREVQNRKLQAVIRHAYEKVPYYTKLFQSAGLSPDDIQTVEDLHRVPITAKDDLKAAGIGQITAGGIDLASCFVLHTSGTTGKPFRVYLSRSDLQTRKLIEFRALLSIGFRPGDRLTVLGPEHPHTVRFHERLGLFRSVNIHSALPLEEQIRLLKSSRPTILWAYPTALKAVLHSVDYRLDTLARPRMLITSSGIRDEFLTKRIQDALGIEMFDFYGANEVGRIAWECPAHEGLHLNGDHLIFECVHSNQPAETGIPCEVIITSLNAWTQPFIRYRLGDNCVFKERPCSCGMAFPLTSAPLGRSNDLIRLPSGRIVSADPLEFILRKLDSIEQFRIIQESIDHLIFQLAFRRVPPDHLLSEIRSKIMERLPESVRVDIQCVDFMQDENSKFRSFISKLPDEADLLRRV